MKMYLPPRGVPDSRRSFLKKGLFGGLLLALGGGGWLATRKSADASVPEGLKALDAQQYAVMATLIARFAPSGGTFPTPEKANAGLAADRIISMLEEETQAELKQLLMLFENALPNFLFGFRTTPFTQLTIDEQEVVLTEWRDSSLTLRRTGYRALRGVAVAAYYQSPETWPAIGYAGPPKGIHDPNAPVWKGGGEPRPVGNGTYIEQVAEAPPKDVPAEPSASPDAGVNTP